MYYCRKCKRTHATGSIARRHKVFAIPMKTRKRKTRKILAKILIPAPKPRTKRRISQKPLRRIIKQSKSKPVLVITKKPKPIRKPKKQLKRKPNITWSKKRRGQLRYRLTDPHERKEITMIRKASGGKLTHIQAVNLWKKSRSTGLDIDVISLDLGTSQDRAEIYEYAMKKINQKLDPIGTRTIRSLSAEASSYGF